MQEIDLTPSQILHFSFRIVNFRFLLGQIRRWNLLGDNFNLVEDLISDLQVDWVYSLFIPRPFCLLWGHHCSLLWRWVSTYPELCHFCRLDKPKSREVAQAIGIYISSSKDAHSAWQLALGLNQDIYCIQTYFHYFRLDLIALDDFNYFMLMVVSRF